MPEVELPWRQPYCRVPLFEWESEWRYCVKMLETFVPAGLFGEAMLMAQKMVEYKYGGT